MLLTDRVHPFLFCTHYTANMDISNNDFDEVDKDLCKLDVMEGGEMVEFRADCNICRCESLCHTCVGGE